MNNTVNAADWEGYANDWLPWRMPKFTIRCGYCSHTFEDRLQKMNPVTATCPNCKKVNILKGLEYLG